MPRCHGLPFPSLPPQTPCAPDAELTKTFSGWPGCQPWPHGCHRVVSKCITVVSLFHPLAPPSTQIGDGCAHPGLPPYKKAPDPGLPPGRHSTCSPRSKGAGGVKPLVVAHTHVLRGSEPDLLEQLGHMPTAGLISRDVHIRLLNESLHGLDVNAVVR